MDKPTYRKYFYERLKQYRANHTVYEQKRNIEYITRHLEQYLRQTCLKRSKVNHILIYKPFASEIPIDIIAKKIQKRIPMVIKLYYPIVLKQSLKAQSIKKNNEHLPIYKIDTIITPGLFINHNKVRLGRGGGFYDRTLSYFYKQTIFVGYSWQIQNNIPIDSHDKKVKKIITDAFRVKA